MLGTYLDWGRRQYLIWFIIPIEFLTFIWVVDGPEPHAHDEGEPRNHSEHPYIECCSLG